MRRIAAALALSLAFPPMAGASPAADDSATAQLGDDYFGAGANVVLAEPITGDALMAGGTVESNASVGGDATVAGGRVAVRATVGDDLYVAGGEVEVDALVNGNARIAGGRVSIAPETRIDGGVAIAGGNVTVAGHLGRYLTVAGGDVTLAGEVAGDVRVYADTLTVAPGTHVGGRLIHRTSRPVAIPPGVVIEGGVGEEAERGWRGRESRNDMIGVGWLWVAGLFAVGLLLAYAFARFSHRTTRVLTERPWLGMGIGFLILTCVPAAAGALAITIIGIPLALILVLVYLAMLIAGYVVGALYVGDRGLAAVRKSPPTAGWRLLALFVALLAIGWVSWIPLFGWLVRGAVLLLGLGGIALAFWRPTDAPVAPPPARPPASVV